MKSKIWILLYVLLLLLLFFFEFQTKTYVSQKSTRYAYEIEQNSNLEKLVQVYTQPLEGNEVTNQQWGISFKKVKKTPKVVEANKTKLTEVTLKEKTLCIEKECFKLLGIFYQDQAYYASFYNKNLKEKIQVFWVGEILSSGIKIKNIFKKNVFFEDINSTREWKMRLFDINSSKYKPKEFE